MKENRLIYRTVAESLAIKKKWDAIEAARTKTPQLAPPKPDKPNYEAKQETYVPAVPKTVTLTSTPSPDNGNGTSVNPANPNYVAPTNQNAAPTETNTPELIMTKDGKVIKTGSKLKSDEYENKEWTNRGFMAPGSVIVDPKTGRTITYGEIDWENGTQRQTSSKGDPFTVPGDEEIFQEKEMSEAEKKIAAEAQAEKDKAEQEGIIEAEYQKNYEAAQRLVEQGVLDVNPYPQTYAEYLKRKGTRDDADMAYLKAQNAIGSELDKAALDRSGRQSDAAISGTNAAMAQGREGAMSGTAPKVAQEFKAEMDQLMHENKLRFNSAEMARNEAERKLKEAQDSGDEQMAQVYSGQLAAAKQDMLDARLEASQLANDATDRALKISQMAKYEADTQATQIDNISTMLSGMDFSKMNSSQMTEMAMTLSANTGVPFNIVSNLQAQASITNQITQTTDIAKRDKLQKELAQLVAEEGTWGKTAAQQEYEFFDSLKTEAEQKKYMELKRANPNFQYQQMDDGSWLQFDPSGETAPKVVYTPAEGLEGVFQLDGVSKYREEGEWECGEGYNKITDGSKVGDSYSSKLGATKVNGKPRQSGPQIGNGLVIPIGDIKNGHIGTVIGVDGDTIQTVEWNHNGDGLQTFESYSIEQLNNDYGKNWGLTDSKLKSSYQNKLEDAQNLSSGAATELARLAQEYIDGGLDKDKAYLKAKEDIKDQELNQKTVKGQVDKNLIAMSKLDEIIEDIGKWQTGDVGFFGKILSYVPATNAYDIEKKLDTVKAIIGFDQLQQMRNASKTGGALGQVSEMENRLLQSVLGSLDIGQSGDEFINSVNQIKDSLTKINEAAQDDFIDYDGTQKEPYVLPGWDANGYQAPQ